MGDLFNPNREQQFVSLMRRYAESAKRSLVMIDFVRVEYEMALQIRVSYDYRSIAHQQLYIGKFNITDEALVRDHPSQILELVDKQVISFVKSLPEQVTGKYPHIRLWADMNEKVHRHPKPLFGHPEEEIPGFVFGRYRSGTGKRYDELNPFLGTEVEVTPLPIYNPDGTRPVGPEKLTEQEEEEIMEATKKRVIKKKTPTPVKPPIDPNKVKKQQCPTEGHGDMRFDPVGQKWRCKTAGCKMVARPVKDADDRSITIGKGETTLRIVATEEEVVVLLISDDNLALNITNLIDVPQFLRRHGLLELATTADQAGNTTFVDTTPRDVTLNLRVGGIGVENLLIHHPL